MTPTARAEPCPPAAPEALPARRHRQVALALALVAAALPLLAPVQWLDHRLLDLGQRALRAAGPAPAAAEVVIVGVDDATLRAFPEPVALWHARLATLFAGLAAAGPRAVGLDIELPDRSLAFIDPALDRALLKGLAQLARAAPLVVARGVDREGRLKPVFAPYLSVLGPEGAALAAWETDADGIVRRFEPRLADRGGAQTAVETFAGLLARRLGRAPGRGLIDYAVGPAYDYLPAAQVHDWALAGKRERLAAALGGKVVLIGSVLAFEDRHRAPVALAGWEDADTVPGVLLHAQALRAMLGGGLVAPAPRPVAMLLAALAAALWFAAARPAHGIGALALTLAALALGLVAGLRAGIFVPIGAATVAAGLATAARIGVDAWLGHRQRLWMRRAFAGAVSL